jgi:MoaA/NifB/PqqE/SkfB family radical SAM enzyme
LQGEGESLLHKEFFEMARRARARGIRLSMITNGSLLSAERVDAILDVGMEAINVSIESPEPARFRQIRGGDFDKVRGGIARLLAARRGRGLAAPQVGFAVTVLRDTIDTLPRVAALYAALDMDGGATLQPLNRMAGYSAVYDSDTAARLLDPEDEQRLWRLVRATPALQAMVAAGTRSRHFYAALSRRFAPAHGCPWVRGGLYVDRHGAMTTCCMVKDSAAHGLGRLGITPAEAVLAQRRAVDAALTVGQPPAQCTGCGYYRAPGSAKHGVTPE